MPAGDLLVLSVEQKEAKNKKPYLSLKVRLPNDHPLREQGMEDLAAKIWSNAFDEKSIPPVDRIISADYAEQEWQGETQLTINRYTLRPANLSKECFLATSAVDQEIVYQKLFCHKWATNEMNLFFKNLRGMLEAHDNFLKKRLFEIPAGSKNHHARRAGLLQHMEEIWDFALKLLGSNYFDLPLPITSYPDEGLPHFKDLNIDQEIVLAGIVMHDLGKVHDYSPTTLEYESSRQGAYLEHSNWSALIIASLWPKDGDRDRLLHLIHVVLSHHGSRQTGASVDVKTPEAVIVHLLDAFSARMDVFRTSYVKTKNGSPPPYNKMFSSQVITPSWPKTLLPNNDSK
jgi:3'-5' exoribonuclease